MRPSARPCQLRSIICEARPFSVGVTRPFEAVANNVKLLRESAVLDRARPRTDPLLPRGVERVIVRVLGRPVRCSHCGRELFRTVPLVWRGEVWLIGAYDHVVRASFNSSETIELGHCHLDECPSPERPWVA